ncbi:MAG: hypothetical protein EOO56_10380 [Hymenobacter sp.]|nr:MAG: hypothetical protein EOO56_10380 [Hymenobacter sp.]
MKLRFTLLLLLSLCALSSYGQQIDIALPDHYQGWVFIIPVHDTVAFPCPLVKGKYLATTQGVAYIPDAYTHKKFQVRLFQQGHNVEPETKYAGLVEDYSAQQKVVYRYVEFYLPESKERPIPSSAEYWRQANRMTMLSKQKKDRFNTLLTSKQIFFK